MTEDKGESFADLFEQAGAPPGRSRDLSVGDEVEGIVAHVGPGEVIVELDAKQQGFFEKVALADSAGAIPAVGDTIRGFVVEIDRSGQIRLDQRFGRDVGAEQLSAAREQQIPIEGKVTGVNKGGLEVEVAGVQAFCPISQAGDRYVEDPSSFVGQTLRFLVTEIRDRGGAVLSRRKLLEMEAREQQQAAVSRIVVGSVQSGHVTQLRDFGAFVDLGGVEGLIPRSELSHERARPEDVLSVGDVVEVKIKGVEEESGRTRITLSLKALATDPWEGIGTIAPLGRVVAGHVSRTAEFGAFVRLSPGVEGLLHVSELGPEDAVEVGQQVLCVIKSVDPARRRVGLGLAQEGDQAGSVAGSVEPIVGAVVAVTVTKIEHFGAFVQLAGVKGRAGRGLIPNAEIGLDRGVDLRKELPVGKELQAKVLEVGEGRLRLSVRAAHEDAERAVYDGFRQEQAPPKSMGTLGELLKKKGLGKPEK